MFAPSQLPDPAAMPCHTPADPTAPAMKMVAAGDGSPVMIMGGMPTWLFLVAVAAILVVSFVLVERVGAPSRKRSQFRFNLIAHPRIYAMVRSRWFQAVPQLVAVATFGFVIWVGLMGNRIGNLTPIAVWTIWWAGLVFVVALAGPLFCFACPWDGIANLLSRFRLARHTEPLSLGLKVPRALRNMWPAIGLFVLLTWAELGLGVTTDPRSTAYMGIGMAVLAVGGVLLFRNKAFCAYLCPVGRISGTYANFSPVEVRARDPKICATCRTQDCLRGGGTGYPCPTGISLRVVNDATMCTMCTECVKSCDKDNVALNLRPFGHDLWGKTRVKPDEAWMCVILLALTLFHGFSMTTSWEDFMPGEASLMKWLTATVGLPRTAAFTLGMVGACAIPVLAYRGSCHVAAWLTRGSGVGPDKLFRAYAFSLLPVALFYHLAHNAMHLLMEGGALIPALSDPLGRGQDWFGTAGTNLGHLVTEASVWNIQIGLIITGHLFGIVVAHRISRRLFEDRAQATRSLVPMLAVMILTSIAGLSLMVLDMNMRMGRM
jgi:polyferredoxin